MSRIVFKILALVPGVVTGLYAGRLLSELWAAWNGSTELWLAVLITLASVLTCTWLLSRLPLRQTWPVLFLLIYVLYPESSFLAAGLVALFVFLTWWQTVKIPPPRPKSVANYLLPLLLLLLCFVLYLRTLAPDILAADNGEFQLVATNLGVAHPPGFPLYTLLAHLMTRLPFGPTPAYRINLFSAVTSTLALAAVYVSVFKLTRRYLPSIAAVLLLATATTFWAQATTANIRSMTALFAAVIFLALVLFYLAAKNGRSGAEDSHTDRYLILFAVTLGLGITHHASLVFLGLVGIIFILLVDKTIIQSPDRWWRPILAFLIGLLPLLYLPLRANAAVRGASPSLATWQGFLEHALAIGFRGDLFVYLEPALLIERLKIMHNVLTFQFSNVFILITVIALVLLMVQQWRLAFLFGGSALLFTFITATYRAPQTVEYMLPVYVALALVLGTGVGGIAFEQTFGRSGIGASLRYLLTALLVVIAVFQLVSRFNSYSRLSQDLTARDYANSLLRNAPQNALLLANWHWATPLWYLQEVEGARPDLEVRYVFPEGEPYAQTWARRVAEGLADGRNVVATNFDKDAFAALPAAEPLGEAFLFRQEPRIGLLDEHVELDLTLGDTIQILGYQIDRQELPLGEEMIITLAWQSVDTPDPSTTLFAHLVGADGRLSGQSDVTAAAQDEGITLTQLRLTPFAGAQPGEKEIHIGAYAEEPLPAEDGATRTPVSTVQLGSSAFAPVTKNPLQRILPSDSTRRLVGYDRDNTLPGRSRLYLHWRTGDGFISEVYDNDVPALPPFSGPWGVSSNRWDILASTERASYVPLGQGIVWTGNPHEESVSPGKKLVLDQTFQSAFPVTSDLVVSVRLIGFEEDGFHWAWWDLNDAIPAMGAIPSLKWIAGSTVTSPHFVTVDQSAQPDQEVGGALTLYDAFTGRVLPVLDNHLANDYGWIPLGRAHVENNE